MARVWLTVAEKVDRKRPLAGIRAVEMALIWAGPYCGTLLGDLGAEVVKVEYIQGNWRGPINPPPNAPGFPDGDPGPRPWNRSSGFNAVNRNKLGLTLDLKDPAGVEAFKDLVAVSDIVFTNYAFGVMDAFGLGYDDLRRVRPDIIMMPMPGYGNTGPYRGIRSMGMSIDAVSGHSALRGYPDLDLSMLSQVHHPDAVAAVTAAFALCVALHQRARTGQGQLIDMSQAESFMPHLGEMFLEYGLTGQARERRGNTHPAMAPHGVYPCQGEDRWVAIAVRGQMEWQGLCEAMGAPELAVDPRFADLEDRLRHRAELDDEVSLWTRGRDRYEVAEMLQKRGIAAGPVLGSGADAYDDPHLQERGFFQIVDHPDAGVHLLSGPIWKMASEAAPLHGPAPMLGEHNGYLLGDLLGYPPERLAALERDEVIGDAPLADLGQTRRPRPLRT